MHCAGRASVVPVADDYFSELPEPLWLLEIDPSRLSAELRFEAAAPIEGGGTAHLEGAELFPHVYGPIELAAIRGAGVLARGADGHHWPARFAPLQAHGRPAADARTARTRVTYDELGARYMGKTSDRTRVGHWLDRLAGALPPGGLVVDAGCGPGFDAAELRRRGLRAVACDLSAGMLRAGLDAYPGPRVQADLRALPFRDESLAGFWANASLLHLEPEGLVAALVELARVTRKGGRGHVSLKQGVGGAWEVERYGVPRWFRYWGADALDTRLRSAGFRVLEASTEEVRDTWLARLVERSH